MEATQKANEVIMEVAGLYALPFDQRQPAAGLSNQPGVSTPKEASTMSHYAGFRAATIFGGSSEMQRNILAKLSLVL